MCGSWSTAWTGATSIPGSRRLPPMSRRPVLGNAAGRRAAEQGPSAAFDSVDVSGHDVCGSLTSFKGRRGTQLWTASACRDRTSPRTAFRPAPKILIQITIFPGNCGLPLAILAPSMRRPVCQGTRMPDTGFNVFGKFRALEALLRPRCGLACCRASRDRRRQGSPGPLHKPA